MLRKWNLKLLIILSILQWLLHRYWKWLTFITEKTLHLCNSWVISFIAGHESTTVIICCNFFVIVQLTDEEGTQSSGVNFHASTSVTVDAKLSSSSHLLSSLLISDVTTATGLQRLKLVCTVFTPFICGLVMKFCIATACRFPLSE